MKPEDSAMLGELRAFLLSSLDFAEEFGRNEPKYAAAVADFSQEIRRIKKEFIIRKILPELGP